MNSFNAARPRATFPCCPAPTMSHSANVARMNAKNPHAVALGKMTSGAKASAAQENGKKGGRPEGS